MLTKISNAIKAGKQHNGFGIQILFPGKGIGSPDTGIGTIGRIDQAVVLPRTLVPMHSHQDDEILTYLRSGKVKHTDSEGHNEMISNQRMMMMNAGAKFQHEELVQDGDVLTGLQIFLRPEKNGLTPKAQFYDFGAALSMNKWRALAGKEDTNPLQIRSSTWLYDIRMDKDSRQPLPALPITNASCLVYVFDGEVSVNEAVRLTSGESVFVEDETIQLKARQRSDVVLFVTDKKSNYSTEGMYSGNQNK